MTPGLSHQGVVIELVRDAAFSSHQASSIADAIVKARWGRRPRTYGHYFAAARRRQKGAGFASAFLTVTDEQLAQADADIGWRLDPVARATARAARDAEFGAAPFRLTGHGLERIP
jgi:hypothetical protein